MSAIKYLCLNGSYIKSDKPLFEADNRGFLYGDALFETIHANGTLPQFPDMHLERLKRGMKLIKMEIPEYFTKEYFTEHIKGVLTRNKFFQGARVRITVFRNSGGLYTPESDKVSYLIDTAKLEHDVYTLNQTGISVDIYPDVLKSVNPLSSIKSTSSLFFVLAALFRKENNLDDCLILNERERICESVSSNIFILKGDKYYTPSLKEGCLPGIMRQIVCELIRAAGYYLNDECSLTINDLHAADEVFLTNAVSGIKWVLAFRNRRYYNKSSKLLISMLNRRAFDS